MPPPEGSTPPRLPPGEGLLCLSSSHHNHHARFSTLLAAYPLKLLSPTPLPSQPANVAAVYTLAYGGGLVAGDVVSLRVDVGRGCGLVMLTQGSTKVFKRRPGIRPLSHSHIPHPRASSGPAGEIITRQRMHITLQPNSFLFLLPDSISPFRASSYSQAQRFVLPEDRSASVLVLDWVNSGRGQRPGWGEEEIWSMDVYGSTNEVFVGKDRLVMRERMVLDNSLPPSKTPNPTALSPIARQLSPYNIYATLLLLGPHLNPLLVYLKQIADRTRQFQLKEPMGLVWSFSEVDEQLGGAVVRIAAREVEDARKWLRGVMTAAGVGGWWVRDYGRGVYKWGGDVVGSRWKRWE